jgi:hypothetical protein
MGVAAKEPCQLASKEPEKKHTQVKVGSAPQYHSLVKELAPVALVLQRQLEATNIIGI